ncbi:helix-turn-helix domain-containing protein [Bacillus sp. mrc49]|uniref:helix-turn-helix domain-containing protein n=1 Tax=Bacillus sp. mrc49 TaxID=2054913 RepID=UPI000C2752CE|nr:helix-turn-helix transcriptional regulator [Bacillus sp. mrc49]PJN91798.1 transcriptional regulator [Bacillus sp. mrc49]
MIGKNIAELRKKRGYTLSELAEQANISKSYLSNIERNLNQNPSLQVMEKIAHVLNVDFVSLLKKENTMAAPYYLETEWIEFVQELKSSGLEKEQIPQYKPLIEFIRWQNESQK